MTFASTCTRIQTKEYDEMATTRGIYDQGDTGDEMVSEDFLEDLGGQMLQMLMQNAEQKSVPSDSQIENLLKIMQKELGGEHKPEESSDAASTCPVVLDYAHKTALPSSHVSGGDILQEHHKRIPSHESHLLQSLSFGASSIQHQTSWSSRFDPSTSGPYSASSSGPYSQQRELLGIPIPDYFHKRRSLNVPTPEQQDFLATATSTSQRKAFTTTSMPAPFSQQRTSTQMASQQLDKFSGVGQFSQHTIPQKAKKKETTFVQLLMETVEEDDSTNPAQKAWLKSMYAQYAQSLDNDVLSGDMQRVLPSYGDLQRVLPSSSELQRAKPSSGDMQRAKPPSGDLQRVLFSSGDLQRAKPPSGDMQRAKPPSGDMQRAKPSSGDMQRAKPPSGDLQRVLFSSGDLQRAKPPSGDMQRAKPPSGDMQRVLPPSDDIQLPTSVCGLSFFPSSTDHKLSQMKDLQPVSSRGNHLSFDESKQSIEDRQVFDYGHSSCGAKRPSITDSRDELLSQTNDGQSHSMKKKRRHSDLADEEVLIQLNPSMWYCILCCFPVPAANSQEAARHLNSGKHVGSINNTKKQSIFKPRHSRDSSKERHSTSTSELANEGLSIAEFFSARVRDEGRCEPLPEEFPAAKNVKIPSLMSMNIPPPTKPIQQQNVPVPPPPKKQDAKKKDIEKPLPPFILAAGETGYPFSRFESKNYCTLCKVFIREAEILSDHLESERHAVNLIDHKKDISINAILDPNSLTEGDGKYKTLVELLTSSTRMSVSQRLKQDKIIRKTGQYDLCLVCYEEIPKDTSKNLLIHPEPKHVAMRLCYTKLMSLMSVFKKLVNPNLRSNAFAFVDKLEQVLDDVPCKLCANQSFIINHGKIISDFGRRKKGAYHLLFGSNCKNQEKHVNFATHRRLMKYVKVIIKVTKAARNEDGKTIVQIIKDYEDQVFGDKDGSTVSCDKCDRVIPKAHHHKKPNHHTCIILQEMVIALQSLKTMKCVNEQGMYPTIQSVGNGNDDEDEEYLAIKEDVKKTNPAPSGEEFDDLTQLLERKQDLENALQSLKTMKCVNEQGMYLTIQSTGNGNDVEDADYLAIKKEVKKTNPAPSGEEVDDLTQLLERKQQDLENADCYSLTSMDLNSNEEDESD